MANHRIQCQLYVIIYIIIYISMLQIIKYKLCQHQAFNDLLIYSSINLSMLEKFANKTKKKKLFRHCLFGCVCAYHKYRAINFIVC